MIYFMFLKNLENYRIQILYILQIIKILISFWNLFFMNFILLLKLHYYTIFDIWYK